MKFYIASGLENFEQVRLVVAHLKQRGHIHTYDWTTHGDVRSLGCDRMAEVAQNEVDAVYGADLVLALFPGARGTHTELGIAIAQKLKNPDKQVWLWSESGEHFAHDERTCTFYFYPGIKRLTGTIDKLLEELDYCFGDEKSD